MMLFYAFLQFVLQKMLKIMNIWSFSLYLAANKEKGQNWPYIHDFQPFLQNKLQKYIKLDHLRGI